MAEVRSDASPSKEDEDLAWVNRFFQEYVFGFIFNDIRAAIDGKANYLAALGLVAYTEFMGGLVIGDLAREGSRQKRLAFLSRMGAKYDEVSGEVWERVRNGLVHSYFIKQDSTVVMEGERGAGLESRDGKIVFRVKAFYGDFQAAVYCYHEELIVKRDTALLQNFNKAVGHLPALKEPKR